MSRDNINMADVVRPNFIHTIHIDTIYVSLDTFLNGQELHSNSNVVLTLLMQYAISDAASL